jgi:hypothetical protein
MPIYRIRCDHCGAENDLFRTFKTYNDLPDCCGEPMHRVPCAALVANDINPYRSMIDGSIINSRSRHREHLRDHGCIEVGNETKYLKDKPLESPPGLKETLIRVANEKLRR